MTIKVAIIGLGTVGSGVAQILQEKREQLASRAGQPIELACAVVRDLKKSRPVELPAGILTEDVERAFADDVDIVLELIGGTTFAKEIVLRALKLGKHVVTANKAMICDHGEEIFAAARKADRTVAFEAAVAGGVPIIKAVSESLAANQITKIQGILNGTCNFILTEMFDKGAAYGATVQKAQEIGYAEADPSMDVGGTDAAQKLTILTQLAFGTKVPLSDFLIQGIDTLGLEDLQYVATLGYRIKLLATAQLTDGRLELHTQPTLIRAQRPMADVQDAYNMIEVVGDSVGRTWFSGMGAGQMPTASAVVSDLIDLTLGRAQITFKHLNLWGQQPPIPLLPKEQIRRRYYLRFQVYDRPHTMADLSDILGRHGISISSCIQSETLISGHLSDVPREEKGSESLIPLVIITHETAEGNMLAADAELSELESVQLPYVRLPVRD